MIRRRLRGAVFVTGTDTGVGKTVVCAGLLQALRRMGLRVAGMKPVATGARRTRQGLRNDDALALAAAAGGLDRYDDVNPCVFAPPIAPHIAAARAGVRIRIAGLRAAYRRLAAGSDWVVVEGVGGWRVPLGARTTVADLARALRLPAVLVVGLRLGCINHALLTAEAIVADGVPLAGWIANSIEARLEEREEIISALTRRIDAPLLARVPWLAGQDGDRAARALAPAAALLAREAETLLHGPSPVR